MPTTGRVRRRVAVACIVVSMAGVIAVEILGQGDPLFSPFTTFMSGQIAGVLTIVVGVVLFAASFCILAPTPGRAALAVLSVVVLYGGAFVLNTRLFDTYQLDRERHPSTWYLSTVLPLSIAVLGLVLGWLLAFGARGWMWLSLVAVLWTPALYRPLFQVALAGGDNHPGWQIDRLSAFADAMTEAYEFALLVFAPVGTVMVVSVLLNRRTIERASHGARRSRRFV